MNGAPGPSRARAAWWLALAFVTLVAGWLRCADLESFRIGPDDGSYLHSARIHALPRGGGLGDNLRADAAWAREVASLHGQETEAYQHSYLHQLATRWLYRSGLGALESLRASSAILGTLTVVCVALLARALLPQRPWIALLAAAFTALSPLHAFLSRTGWGQAGFACWYLAFLTLAYRTLIAPPEPDRRRRVLLALGMIATSVLAYGWHEGVVPYVAGTALAACAAPWIRGERWRVSTVLRSPRTWTYVAGASVVGLFTVALFFSSFAREYWFDAKGRAPDSMPWIEVKWRSLENLFVQQRLDLVLTWPLLALAPGGVLWLRRTHRTALRWIAANAGGGALLLVVLFGDAFLLRAYLPSYLLVFVFSACGVAWIADRFGHRTAAVSAGIVLVLLCATTVQTLFGRHLGPLYVQKLYDQQNDLDHRHVDDELYDLLVRERQPDEVVGVFADKACIYKLLDRGIPAREDYMENVPEAMWPRWVVGVPLHFERSRFYAANGGPFVLRAKDRVGRHAVYQRLDRTGY
ncbi:MAG: hypothetical protein JNK02_11585 [Planctomycetes bacterium]|nr:hypothetical protein [Planctomycetota bacterium]